MRVADRTHFTYDPARDQVIDNLTGEITRLSKDDPMTPKTRHDELVALLNKISEESVTTSNVLADMLDLLRERLPVERDPREDSEQSKAWLTLIRHPVAMSVGPLAGRSYIDALLDRLTEMQKAEAERDEWRERLLRLRADLSPGGLIWPVDAALRRDDERAAKGERR